MGKLGKKARKFSKNNLQSMLKRKRQLKSLFKRRASTIDRHNAAEDENEVDIELSNGRNPKAQSHTQRIEETGEEGKEVFKEYNTVFIHFQFPHGPSVGKSKATSPSSTPVNPQSSITHSKSVRESEATAPSSTPANPLSSITHSKSLIFSRIGEAGEECKEVLEEESSVCAQKKEATQVSVQK